MTAYPISSGVTSTGLIPTSGSVETVLSGGTTIRTTINAGVLLDVKNGGTSLSATVNAAGSATVELGGVASSTAVNSGGFETVAGKETGASIGSSGTQAVGGAGVAVGTVVANGGQQIVSTDESDGLVLGGTALSTTLNGGIEKVFRGGTASGVTINNGGLLELGYGAAFYGGNANNVVINSGGRASLNYLGVMTGVIVQGGGVLNDGAGRVNGAVLSGGTERVGGDIGAIDSGTVILAGGVQSVVGYGGETLGTEVDAGGQQIVSNENLATRTTVNNGGLQTVDWEARTSGTIVNSGGRQVILNSVDTDPRAPLTVAYATMVNGGGSQTVSAGGATSATIVGSGASESVFSGGSAAGTTVQFGGSVIAYAGGTLSGTVVNAGGKEIISSGGTATQTFLKQGGSIDLPFLPFTGTTNESIAVQGSIFTITDGGQTYSQQLGTIPAGKLELSSDGSGGTLLTDSGAASSGNSLIANVTIGSQSNLQGVSSASIIAAMGQALVDWGKYVSIDHPLNIEIDVGQTSYPSEVAENYSRLQPAPRGQSVGPLALNSNLTATQAQLEIENRGTGYPGPDIVVTISPQYLSQLYFSANPGSSSYQLPSNKVDGVSLFEHELGHAFGITGLRTQSGSSSGQLPGSESVFDSFIQIGAGGQAYFVGPQALASYGGPVSLTTGQSNGSNYYTVNASAPRLAQDLMAPTLQSGIQYQISGVDLAMLEDIGIPAGLDYNTNGQPAQPNVPVQFASPRSVSFAVTLNLPSNTYAVTWQAPNITNPTGHNAYGVQTQVWLTQTPYSPNAQGYEVSEDGATRTVPASSTIFEGVPSSQALLPPSGNYYVTFVLAEDYNGTGNYVGEDTISYAGSGPNGMVVINNPGVSATISYTPKTPDEGGSDGGGQDSGSGGGTGGGGGSNSNEPGTATPTGPDTWNPVTAHGIPIYRLFDTVWGTEFLTGSSSELAIVEATRPDLEYEGVGLDSIADPTNDPSASPIYRFFDTTYGTHFYSSSATERDTIIATRPDLNFEGTAFYEYATQQPGSAPVYRFFETGNGTHFFTSSETERAAVLQTRPDLTPEGVAFYSPTS